MIFLGDIHGHFDIIIDFINKFSIKNQTFIQVGDFGAFTKLLSDIKELDDYLKLTDNKLYVTRGNHDDPYFWDLDNYQWDEHERKFKTRIIDQTLKNIIFIDNYWATIEGKTVLFYGGSYSIDKYSRTLNYDYFANELPSVRFLLELEHCKHVGIDIKPDIIVTHSAPSIYRPMVYPELPDQILTEHLLNRMHDMFPDKPWFCGHYHVSHIQDHFRCLDINEFYEYLV